jgi:drug/metabolite transporter (DMT)-like permease
MAVGVAAAVLACLLWGGTFVAPPLAPEVSSVLSSAGRFAAFGLVSAAVLSLAGRRGEG